MVVNHDLYNKLNSADDISVFDELPCICCLGFYVFVKVITKPSYLYFFTWKPVGDSETRRLINSIVLEEESDVDANGNPSSHFEMYLDAMNECGADTKKEINDFVNNVNKSYIPSVNIGVDDFLKTTFNIINSNKPHIIASAFTFGREDLIPDMFSEIVNQYNNDNKLDKFVYYLERHIELDGGDHGPLALQLISNL